MIEGSWAQAGAFFASAYLIFGMVRLSWHSGTRYWAKH
jgi:hypothetical protein